MNATCLDVSNLTAGYVPGMPIIHGIDVTVAQGEIVSVIGPNGAGKSTLIKAIAGLIRVENGSVRMRETDITRVRPDRLAQYGIAYVPQTANIFHTLSVEQNLVLAAKRLRDRRAERCEEMLTVFPLLREKHRQRASGLSGGQRQFLAMAMALVAEPRLLLMDEPSAGLAPRAAKETLLLLRSIAAKDVGVLLVEQNVKAALSISDRAYVLAEGRNQLDGEAASLLSDPVVSDIYLGVRRGEHHATESV